MYFELMQGEKKDSCTICKMATIWDVYTCPADSRGRRHGERTARRQSSWSVRTGNRLPRQSCSSHPRTPAGQTPGAVQEPERCSFYLSACVMSVLNRQRSEARSTCRDLNVQVKNPAKLAVTRDGYTCEQNLRRK